MTYSKDSASSNLIPANFKLTYNAKQIAAGIDKIGGEITEWGRQVWKESHTDIVTVPILRGAVFFFADLVRAIKTSVEIAPVHAAAYNPAENKIDEAGVKFGGTSVAVKGRTVLLVDDICDTGSTIAALHAEFMKLGALEVRSAVLIKRKFEKQSCTPDWVGFDYAGPEWFVGYGMDDHDRWRNLPDIYIIQQH